MRFSLTDKLLREAEQFQLRSSCRDCLYVAPQGRCAHEWPNAQQRRWPLDAPDEQGNRPKTVDFCREFELR